MGLGLVQAGHERAVAHVACLSRWRAEGVSEHAYERSPIPLSGGAGVGDILEYVPLFPASRLRLCLLTVVL